MKLSIWKSERPAIKHKGVNLYDCSDCSVVFLLETGLKIHISTVHENNVGNICPICGRILKTAAVQNILQSENEMWRLFLTNANKQVVVKLENPWKLKTAR